MVGFPALFKGADFLLRSKENMAQAAAAPKKKVEGLGGEKLHVWPYLVRLEFLCALLTIIALTVWSIVIDAPL